MKRFLMINTVLIGLFLGATQSSAYSLNGTLMIVPNRASAIMNGFSSKFEFSVHRLTTQAIIFEEGNIVQDTNKTCNKQTDSDLFPKDLTCTKTAKDTSVTIGCFYCASGFLKGYTIFLGLTGTPKSYGPDCRDYEPAGGGPGGDDP